MLYGELAFFNARMFALIMEPIFGKTTYFMVTENNLIEELATIFTILGGVLVAFSKTKDEDEMVHHIRTNALIWAVYVNYALLLLACLMVYGLSFNWVVLVNLISILLFTILKFHWQLYKMRSNL